jgi:tetratricopeptide (TPR) repeat protein/TolB-like protein
MLPEWLTTFGSVTTIWPLLTMNPMLNKTLGHYRVIEKIGAGGMGVVYRAHDEQLDRDVAIKVLPPGTLSDESSRRRFRREAMSLAKLNHPHVGAVYDFGQQDGIDYLVMELVTGISLDMKLTSGPLPEREAIRLGIQMVEGLEAAHGQGIIHRDLKPGNLRLTADGRLKVLDFGLAQWTTPEDVAGATVTLTKPEEVSGTVPYMAPEQLRGQRADERSDLYSAGTVLYEMVTGKRAFASTSGPQLVAEILERAPSPPSSHNRQISPALESVVLKALDKDPGLRYQSAKEMRVDLERMSSGTIAVSPRQVSRIWRLVPVALLLVAAVVAVYLSRWKGGFGKNPTSTGAPQVSWRRSVAVVGFRNLSGKPDEAWLSTALSEMLTTELAAGEQLRTVPGENVARMKSDLSLVDGDSFGAETLARIRKRLGTDLVVLGSYLATGKNNDDKIRLDLRLQDTAAGETIALLSETGTQSELLDLVSRTGAELRQKLGVGGVSASEEPNVRASLPTKPEAARLYSEGLAKLRLFESQQARDLLERAVLADPNHAPSHAALASALSALGYDAKAQEQAKKAFELSSNLSRQEKLSIEAGYRELVRDWPKAIESYRTLWGFFPDNVDYGLRLANAQTDGGQGNEALKTIQVLQQLPPPATDDARIDLAESKAASALGDFKHAQSAAVRAAQKGQAQAANLVVAQALIAQGGASERLGQSDEAMKTFTQAQQLFTAAGNQRGAAVAVQRIGDVFYDKGDYDAARKRFEESLATFRRLGAQQNTSSALNRIGNVFYELSNLEQARNYYEQGLKIDREVGDKAGIAGGLGNLANVLDGLGDLKGAVQLQRECLQAFTEVGDKRGMGSTLNNLAVVLQEIGDLPTAKLNYEQAIRVQKETAHRRGEAFATFGLSEVYLAEGDLAEARKYSEQSLRMRQEIGETLHVALSNVQMANLALEEGQPDHAEKLVRGSIPEFEKQSAWDLESNAYAILARAAVEQKDLQTARDAADRSTALAHKAGNRPPIFDAELATARVLSAEGKTAEAMSTLQGVLADAKKFGYVPYQLEARLALGQVEMKSGKVVAGRSRLSALEKEARAKDFNLIAAKAAKYRA